MPNLYSRLRAAGRAADALRRHLPCRWQGAEGLLRPLEENPLWTTRTEGLRRRGMERVAVHVLSGFYGKRNYAQDNDDREANPDKSGPCGRRRLPRAE